MSPRNQVLYCGVAPYPGAPTPPLGGFLSGTRMVTESTLFDHTELALNAFTHPLDGGYVGRLLEDRRRFRESLQTHPDHDIVLMQVGQYRSVYREWLVARMARGARRKLVLDIRAGTVLDFLERDANPLERFLFDRVVAMADLVLVQCQSFVEPLQHRYPRSRIEWFANFVPASRARPREAPPYAAGQCLKLVYFGHFIPQKGIVEMVEALRRARDDRGLDVELHLAGEGQDPAILAAIAGSQGRGVVDHGRLRPGELWSLLGRVHALVYPTSHWGEGHTNAVNEALMNGLVIVATPFRELPRILPDSGTLWLDPEHLSDSLVERIAQMVADPDFVNRAAESNRRFLLENYSDQRWIPFLESRFDELSG